jgi:hypothetical protein
MCVLQCYLLIKNKAWSVFPNLTTKGKRENGRKCDEKRVRVGTTLPKIDPTNPIQAQ